MKDNMNERLEEREKGQCKIGRNKGEDQQKTGEN